MTPAERYHQVALIHAANLDQGFLATLGVPFLALMYRAVDEANDSVLLTEGQDGRLVGFVAGSVGMRAICGQMLRYPFQLATALFPSLARPRRLRRILEVMFYSTRSEATPALPHAELLSVAVDPRARGSGVAERLYRRLQSHFADRGLTAFRIIVGESLGPAHRFYLRMGAKPVAYIEIHSGERSVVYVQDVSRATSHA